MAGNDFLFQRPTFVSSQSTLARFVARPVLRFIDREVASGVLLLIAPRGFPARLAGLAWLLPLLLGPVPRPRAGDVWLTLLDVGQGLSAVVRTRSRVLIFDAGPRYRRGFDAGRDVVAPYLRHQGVDRVDLLIVSHEHNDHRGGARGLLDAVPVAATDPPLVTLDAFPVAGGSGATGAKLGGSAGPGRVPVLAAACPPRQAAALATSSVPQSRLRRAERA